MLCTGYIHVCALQSSSVISGHVHTRPPTGPWCTTQLLRKLSFFGKRQHYGSLTWDQAGGISITSRIFLPLIMSYIPELLDIGAQNSSTFYIPGADLGGGGARCFGCSNNTLQTVRCELDSSDSSDSRALAPNLSQEAQPYNVIYMCTYIFRIHGATNLAEMFRRLVGVVLNFWHVLILLAPSLASQIAPSTSFR